MSEVFLTLFNRSLNACWLIAVVLALRLVFRGAPRWPRLLLWALVGFRLLPFSIPHPWSLVPTREVLPQEMLLSPTPHIESGIPAVDAAVNPVFTPSLAPDPGASVNPLQVLTWLAGWVWLIGLAGMLLYAAVSWLRLRARLRTAVRLRDNIWQSDQIAAPFVLGFFRPRVYLPFSLPEKALPSVVAHEQAHIACKDHWFKPLGFAFLAVYWFNPAIWLAYILFCRDMEAACDERVVQKLDPAGRADYSQALLACSLPRRRVAPCPLAFGEAGVKSRVKAVLRYKKPAAVLLGLLLTSVTLSLTFFAYDPPDDSLEWARNLRAEDVARIELVVMPQDTGRQYKQLDEAETNRAVDLIRDCRGVRLSRHEALTGGGITFYVTTTDGVTHTVANAGNAYLLVDGAYFDAGYDWLSAWETDWGEGDSPIPDGFFENMALTSDGLPQLSEALNAAIRTAVLSRYEEPAQGLLRAESHAVLDMTQQNGQTLVCALVREETFDLTGSEPVSISSSVIPTALTFSGDEATGYTLLSYWTAQDGSRYESSIRETFTPLAAQRLFAGDTVYSRQLGESNQQKAQAAWEQAHAEESDGSGPVQEPAVQAAFADEALLDGLTGYGQFTDYPSDYQVQLVFTADAPVTDFRFLALTLRDVGADGTMIFDTEELYAADTLPVVIRMTFVGEIPDRGIAYTDANGITRYFALATSGADGSPLLLEFSH